MIIHYKNTLFYFQKRIPKYLLIFRSHQLYNSHTKGKTFVFVPFNEKAKALKDSHSNYRLFLSYSPVQQFHKQKSQY